MINVNLAVINFLPIPALDGGHMTLLIYEWLRGKPPPDAVYIALNVLGISLILALMGFVIYLDVQRLFF
jgi:regulator of sigma E protease